MHAHTIFKKGKKRLHDWCQYGRVHLESFQLDVRPSSDTCLAAEKFPYDATTGRLFLCFLTFGYIFGENERDY